jgi:type II secretory pathway component GspD/PulD (secretin)
MSACLRLTAFALALAACSHPARAQYGGVAGAAGPEPRQMQIFRLQQCEAGDAKSLIENLQSGLRVEVDARTNSLVVSGTADDLQTVEAVLQTLDTPPATEPVVIDIEITLLQQSRQLADGDEPHAWPPVDADAVLKRTAQLDGVTLRSDFHLRATDQQSATIQTGGTEAVPLGRTIDAQGRSFRASFEQRSVGTLIKVTPTRRRTGEIALQCQFESSRLGSAASPDTPAPVDTLQTNSTIVVRPGVAANLGGFRTDKHDAAGRQSSRTLLLIRATESPAPAPQK